MRILLPIAFILFLLWIVLMANQGRSTLFFEIVKITPFGDKIGHFVLSGLLTFVLNVGLDNRRLTVGGRTILLGTGLAILFMTIEELSQLAIPRRSFSLIDYSAGMLGVYLSNRLATHAGRPLLR